MQEAERPPQPVRVDARPLLVSASASSHATGFAGPRATRSRGPRALHTPCAAPAPTGKRRRSLPGHMAQPQGVVAGCWGVMATCRGVMVGSGVTAGVGVSWLDVGVSWRVLGCRGFMLGCMAGVKAKEALLSRGQGLLDAASCPEAFGRCPRRLARPEADSASPGPVHPPWGRPASEGARGSSARWGPGKPPHAGTGRAAHAFPGRVWGATAAPRPPALSCGHLKSPVPDSSCSPEWRTGGKRLPHLPVQVSPSVLGAGQAGTVGGVAGGRCRSPPHRSPAPPSAPGQARGPGRPLGRPQDMAGRAHRRAPEHGDSLWVACKVAEVRGRSTG